MTSNNTLGKKLLKILRERCSEGDLRDICFHLGIDFDSLPAEGKGGKARELVQKLKQHNRLPDLIIEGKELRPDIDWEDVHDEQVKSPEQAPAYTEEDTLDASTPTPTQQASFAALLHRYRERANLTQVRLAELIQVDRTRLGEWESGKRTPRSYGVVDDLAEILGLSQKEKDEFTAAYTAARNRPGKAVRQPANQGEKAPLERPKRLPIWLHQLPAPVNDFVGRDAEIQRLVDALCGAAERGDAVGIGVIHGMPGVGKTELARVVANRLRTTFPDAHITVDLQGAGPTPQAAAQALQSIIRSFGAEVTASDDLVELQNHYRSLLYNKHVLILADNASDAEQVRPLIPPVGSGLIVTSRQIFTLPGMTTVELGVLEPSDAEKFLLSICPRIDKHAARLAELCGYLPLALRVSASFLKTRPSRSVEDYLKSLADEINRLSILDDDNENNKGVAASLRLSYDKLEQSHQSMFCQLGVFRGDFDRQAAQTIVMVPGEKSGKAREQEIEEALEEFISLSLLEWDASTRRYRLHDLVRLFALSCLDNADEVYWRHANYYARVAADIDQLYQQGGVELIQSLDLFDTEGVNINSGWEWAIHNTGATVIDRLLVDYGISLLDVSDFRYGAQQYIISNFENTLDAAKRLRDNYATMLFCSALGDLYRQCGKFNDALKILSRAIALAQASSNSYMHALFLSNRGLVHQHKNDLDQALDDYEEAFRVYTRMQEPADERRADVLLNMGVAYYLKKRYTDAITYEVEALKIYKEGNNKQEMVITQINLAEALLATKRDTAARRYIEAAISNHTYIPRFYNIDVYRIYAEVLLAQGCLDEALTAASKACSFLPPEAEAMLIEPGILIYLYETCAKVHSARGEATEAADFTARAQRCREQLGRSD
jgi:tetratricopeptide (TPR) repeat protein